MSRRGVPKSAFYVTWLAEELINGKFFILLKCCGRRTVAEESN